MGVNPLPVPRFNSSQYCYCSLQQVATKKKNFLAIRCMFVVVVVVVVLSTWLDTACTEVLC